MSAPPLQRPVARVEVCFFFFSNFDLLFSFNCFNIRRVMSHDIQHTALALLMLLLFSTTIQTRMTINKSNKFDKNRILFILIFDSSSIHTIIIYLHRKTIKKIVVFHINESIWNCFWACPPLDRRADATDRADLRWRNEARQPTQSPTRLPENT